MELGGVVIGDNNRAPTPLSDTTEDSSTGDHSPTEAKLKALNESIPKFDRQPWTKGKPSLEGVMDIPAVVKPTVITDPEKPLAKGEQQAPVEGELTGKLSQAFGTDMATQLADILALLAQHNLVETQGCLLKEMSLAKMRAKEAALEEPAEPEPEPEPIPAEPLEPDTWSSHEDLGFHRIPAQPGAEMREVWPEETARSYYHQSGLQPPFEGTKDDSLPQELTLPEGYLEHHAQQVAAALISIKQQHPNLHPQQHLQMAASHIGFPAQSAAQSHQQAPQYLPHHQAAAAAAHYQQQQQLSQGAHHPHQASHPSLQPPQAAQQAVVPPAAAQPQAQAETPSQFEAGERVAVPPPQRLPTIAGEDPTVLQGGDIDEASPTGTSTPVALVDGASPSAEPPVALEGKDEEGEEKEADGEEQPSSFVEGVVMEEAGSPDTAEAVSSPASEGTPGRQRMAIDSQEGAEEELVEPLEGAEVVPPSAATTAASASASATAPIQPDASAVGIMNSPSEATPEEIEAHRAAQAKYQRELAEYQHQMAWYTYHQQQQQQQQMLASGMAAHQGALPPTVTNAAAPPAAAATSYPAQYPQATGQPQQQLMPAQSQQGTQLEHYPNTSAAAAAAAQRRPPSFDVFELKVIYEANRTGFEEQKEYPININQVIAGRYKIVEFLGAAAFSRAVQCVDLKTSQLVCIKIIRNSKDFFDQSLDEIKLLQYLNKNGDPDEKCCLQLYDYFYHKEHLFLVCELLRDNLYEFSKYNRESGEEAYFTIPRLQKVARQVLTALEFAHGLGLIHCDLKPENILIKSYSRSEVKVIDFGSSCFTTDNLSSYVQSRCYRAPEVVLGLPYNQKIDIWSVGCILAELLTGRVLFHNDSVSTMLARIIAICGNLTSDTVRKAKYAHRFFTRNGFLYERHPKTGQLSYLLPKRCRLEHRVGTSDPLFLDFLAQTLNLDPEKRPSASEALKHPFLTHQYPPLPPPPPAAPAGQAPQ